MPKNKESKKDKSEKIEKKATPKIANHEDEAKRLNRVVGQVEGIRKMLEEGRKLSDVLIQFKAVHSALKSVEERVFRNHVETCVEDIVAADKRKERSKKIEELTELYKQGS